MWAALGRRCTLDIAALFSQPAPKILLKRTDRGALSAENIPSSWRRNSPDPAGETWTPRTEQSSPIPLTPTPVFASWPIWTFLLLLAPLPRPAVSFPPSVFLCAGQGLLQGATLAWGAGVGHQPASVPPGPGLERAHCMWLRIRVPPGPPSITY